MSLYRNHFVIFFLFIFLASACQLPSADQSVRRQFQQNSGDGFTHALDLQLFAAELGTNKTPCGNVPAQGCCDGETLWWCDKGVLSYRSCAARPSCGWNPAGLYDCNTSGAIEPTGTHLMQCYAFFGEAGVPKVDGGSSDSGSDSCGEIPFEGCCDGNTLKFCEDGEIKVLDCALNPSCGWLTMSRVYDCGTPGEEAPGGDGGVLFPKACPGTSLTDGGQDGASDMTGAVDAKVTDGVQSDAGDGGTSNGDCTCSAMNQRPTSSPLFFWLIVAAVLMSRSRRSPIP